MQFNKEKGITLVALMITIIILIILAAVTIFSVTNHNIIGKATTGTEEYAKGQHYELNEMDNVAKILGDFENRVSGGNTSGGGDTPGGGDNPGGTVNVPEDFLNPDGTINSTMIGKYVDYEPNGTEYTVPEGYTISDLSGSTSNSITYTADGSLKWRVFGVEDGKLLLISDNPTSYKLTLSGANGYNNGVGLADGICKANYINSEYREIEVRNLKIEDVEKVTTYDWTTFNSGTATYGETKTYTAAKSYYPNYWSSYDKSDTVPFNERSKQREWVTGSAGGAAEETFRQSYWNHSYSSSAKETEWKDGKYYDLIISPASSGIYWLSSRFVLLSSGYCSFGLQRVSSGSVGGGYPFDSYGRTNSPAYALRPLVSIPLTSCTITELDSDTYHIITR